MFQRSMLIALTFIGLAAFAPLLTVAGDADDCAQTEAWFDEH